MTELSRSGPSAVAVAGLIVAIAALLGAGAAIALATRRRSA